jgi:HupE/UreJ protein
MLAWLERRPSESPQDMKDDVLLNDTHISPGPKLILQAFAIALLLLLAGALFAHGVAGEDADFLERNAGRALSVFTYLGAKHMFTGYDHLLYLVGVIFFLYRPKDIAVYVTLFALGHSITLLAGILGGIHVNVYLIDALIGLSVVYKAFENLDGFESVLGIQPNAKLAVFFFGLAHGFGLATKLQDFALSAEGLVANILSFNIGVEIGQLMALAVLLFLINAWRATGTFDRHAYAFNVLLMFAGFLLASYQMAAYFIAA